MSGPELWVDPAVHGQECERFDTFVVAGPAEVDCAVWTGAIGKDGYGRFFIYRAGVGLCVRPHRWALSRSLGRPLAAEEFGLHECDNPLCVKVSAPGSQRLHVVLGDQRDNMVRMGRMGRGGGRRAIASNIPIRITGPARPQHRHFVSRYPPVSFTETDAIPMPKIGRPQNICLPER